MFTKPEVETMPPTPSSNSAIGLDTRPHTASLDMIQHQKGVFRFTATSTNTTVGINGGLTKAQVPVSSSLIALLSVINTILSYLVLISVIVGTGFLPPALLAWMTGLTIATVELRQWLRLSTSVTVLHMSKITKMEAWELAYKIQRGL